MKRSYFQYILGFIQFLMVIGFVGLSFFISNLLETQKPVLETSGDQDRPLFVETESLRTGSYRISFQTTGIVEARTLVDVVPEVNGRLVYVNEDFFEGGHFEKDEILFEIDPRDYRYEVERLQAEVARAQTALNLEQAESEAAKAEWEQINPNTPIPDLVARVPQLNEARANLRAAQAMLDNAKLNLERTRFSFPFEGRVLSSDLALGRYVSTGQSYGTVFNLLDLEVKSSLEEQQLKWLINQDQLDIYVTATHLGQQNTYPARLKRGVASLDPNTRFASVSFGLEATDQPSRIPLLPGTFSSVVVEGPILEGITKLPPASIQKNNMVWGVDDDNRLVQLSPDIIYQKESYIVVQGLEDPVDVVVSTVEGAAEGMRIQRPSDQITISEEERP